MNPGSPEQIFSISVTISLPYVDYYFRNAST